MTRRRALTSACLSLGLVLGAAACGGGEQGGTATPGSTAEGQPAGTTTTTAKPGPLKDQTSPKSAFGISWDRDKLWVADYDGGQVLAVDPETGAILVRWTGSDGVTKGIDDVIVGPDESLYWTGFDDGSVDRMYQGNFVPVAGLEPGLNGIGLGPGGELYVTHADEGTKDGGDGLWEVDPNGQRQPREILREIGQVNSFAVSRDGIIYGPRPGKRPGRTPATATVPATTPEGTALKGAGSGELVKIDPKTGSIEVIATGFDTPSAAKLSPDGTKVFVLSSAPPAVHVVDLATGEVQPYATLDAMFVNGLAVAPDGTLYVTALDEPTIIVIRPDGTTRKLTIGRPEPATTTTTAAP